MKSSEKTITSLSANFVNSNVQVFGGDMPNAESEMVSATISDAVPLERVTG